ncbi:hypothetical protein CUMW_268160 [Citrus unshiu]|uniref:Protein kinase domain-containing protein n=1 Tax=Citrus unshiu TaxID=55188 RepID=A0A2H5QWH5_CITUN|nr:hypothetical protein CUMW_268160 [Citrus unshiu]
MHNNLTTESSSYFYAFECKLKGNIPKEIGNLRDLVFLSLSTNDLNGTIPASVGTVKQLQNLYLLVNNLQGSIPYDICHLERFGGLFLYENKISSPIPQCLRSLNSLRVRQLASNKLTSIIPSSFLEYILQINLFSNSLSGSLPSNIQNLKWPQRPDNSIFAGNRSQGSIPKSFESLASLEFLDLSSNNLSGKIPKSLEALSNLKELNVSYNRLEGEIPTNVPFGNFSNFPERLNIMIDMALAFEYLHHGRSTPMVHCDLKPSNNLLDEDMVAHVSDFNISKLLGVLLPETFTRKKPTIEMFIG